MDNVSQPAPADTRMDNVSRPASADTGMDNVSRPASADTSNVSGSIADESSSEQELESYASPSQCRDVTESFTENVSPYEKENMFIESPNNDEETADDMSVESKHSPIDEETESNASIPLTEPMESNSPVPTEATESNTSIPSAEAADVSPQEISQQGDSQSTEEDTSDPRIAPKMNCPEKIVFCFDLSTEMVEPPVIIGDIDFAPFIVAKRLIEMFVLTKTRMDSRHEYAVMAFHETAEWVNDFTNDPKDIIELLDDLNGVEMCIDCPFSSIFSLLSAMAVDLPTFPQPEIVPPPFVLRVILIYGRCYCSPDVEEIVKVLRHLRQSPYFFFDILYIHETPSDDNRCEEIFESFCDFDEEYSSYIYNVGRDVTKFYNCMAKLLAHPLLRPLQKDTFYSIESH